MTARLTDWNVMREFKYMSYVVTDSVKDSKDWLVESLGPALGKQRRLIRALSPLMPRHRIVSPAQAASAIGTSQELLTRLAVRFKNVFPYLRGH